MLHGCIIDQTFEVRHLKVGRDVGAEYLESSIHQVLRLKDTLLLKSYWLCARTISQVREQLLLQIAPE